MWWMYLPAIDFAEQNRIFSKNSPAGKKNSCIPQRFLLICIAAKHICVLCDYMSMYAVRNIISSCSLSQA